MIVGYETLTSTVISITHRGTVSFSNMDSVSPPESRHSNLKLDGNMAYNKDKKQEGKSDEFNVFISTGHRHSDLNNVLPPASPKMTGVCGGTWK